MPTHGVSYHGHYITLHADMYAPTFHQVQSASNPDMNHGCVIHESQDACSDFGAVGIHQYNIRDMFNNSG